MLVLPKTISLKTSFVIVTCTAILLAAVFSKWQHAVPVPFTRQYSAGDIVDVFMMPPEGTDLFAGFIVERLCQDVRISEVDTEARNVVIAVSLYEKIQLLNCDRELVLWPNKLDEDPIWVD